MLIIALALKENVCDFHYTIKSYVWLLKIPGEKANNQKSVQQIDFDSFNCNRLSKFECGVIVLDFEIQIKEENKKKLIKKNKINWNRFEEKCKCFESTPPM